MSSLYSKFASKWRQSNGKNTFPRLVAFLDQLPELAKQHQEELNKQLIDTEEETLTEAEEAEIETYKQEQNTILTALQTIEGNNYQPLITFIRNHTDLIFSDLKRPEDNQYGAYG